MKIDKKHIYMSIATFLFIVIIGIGERIFLLFKKQLYVNFLHQNNMLIT